MIFGYVRVSTSAQSAESQQSLIARYLVERRWTLDEWIEVEMSSRRTRRAAPPARTASQGRRWRHGHRLRTLAAGSLATRSAGPD